jgi:hypothetical protein
MNALGADRTLGSAVFDDYGLLRCTAYYRHVYDLLGRACVFVPFTALGTLPLRRMFDSHVFVRSDSNYKLFPAVVLAIGDVAGWMDAYAAYRDELVVLAEVVRFDCEYRCFVRNGVFVCGSSYPGTPYVDVPGTVRAFAETAALRMLPGGVNMVTVDVGVTGDILCLVEVGGVNSWGIYGSNVADFVAAMEAEALVRWRAECRDGRAAAR